MERQYATNQGVKQHRERNSDLEREMHILNRSTEEGGGSNALQQLEWGQLIVRWTRKLIIIRAHARESGKTRSRGRFSRRGILQRRRLCMTVCYHTRVPQSNGRRKIRSCQWHIRTAWAALYSQARKSMSKPSLPSDASVHEQCTTDNLE
jgi:hypothetical protein